MDEIDVVNSGEVSEVFGGRPIMPVFGCNVCGLRFMLEVFFEHLEESGHGGHWLKRYRDK